MEKYKRLSKSQITAIALTMMVAGGGAYGAMAAANNVAAQNTVDTSSQTQVVSDGDGESSAGSIQIGNEVSNDTRTEAEETAQYAGLATITAAEAQANAEAEVGGTASSVQLGNEDGSLVYEVVIGTQEVKVDAGTGAILEVENGDQGDNGDHEGANEENDDDGETEDGNE